MSVPAHAPYDWISLKDIQENDDLIEKYDLDAEKVKAIEPKTIIDVEGYGEVPAKEACEEYGVESQEDEEELDEATEEIYEKEFHTGTLNSNCQDFAGEKVNAVKERLTERFENQGRFDSMYDFSEEVICRCGGDVVVSMQESWFLEYDNPEWQDQVEKCLDQTDLIPEDTREEFEHTIDWLESWPCIRNFGLGTKMPFDQDFVVEPLSDSTIYMAFYTISHLVQEKDSDKLEPEFFDYVFNEKGTAEEVAESTGLKEDFVEECRESFDYWYPMDWRTTAYPLIQNHLTFMLYHHAALFDEPDWPEGIASWGLVTLEGEKMSSSKGNVALPDEEIEKHGADTVRFFLFAKLEPWEDFDWTAEGIREYKNKLQAFYNRTLESYDSGEERGKNKLDRYALSRLQKIIRQSTEGLEEFQTRKSGLKGFYELNSLINKYRNRAETVNTKVINELVETQLKLMTPYIPHTCEELWSEIGKEGMISEEEWPEVEEEKIDEEVENAYELLEETVSDIREVAEIVGDYDRIKVITAAEWKRELFREMEEIIEERPEFGAAMGRLVDEREEHADQIKNFLQSYFDEPGEMPPEILSQEEETEALEENRDFIEREFDAEVEIESEEESEEEKASRAEPGKPAILME
jgi:leucyl-tRNA synthetase